VKLSGWWLDAAVLGSILVAALAMRLVNLGVYSGLFDEGIRTEQLFLMSAGYRPFRDIFAAQGPLLLDLLHPWFVLFGQDLAAARLAVGVYSLLGLAGAYWVGRLVAGVAGGALAALLLAMSPLYLEGSRLALAEVPAMAPAILAVGCALVYAERGGRGWLVATGLFLATSLLIKPITLAAAVPVGLALLGRGRAAWKDLVILVVLVAGLMLVVVFAVGLGGVFEQIVSYRLESRDSEGWSLWKNRAALARALSFEQTALVGLAVGGGVLMLTRRRWRELCLVAWAVASVSLLLAYSPLHGKHTVVMIPPIAIVAGVGLTLALGQLRSDSRIPRAAVVLPTLALVAWYLATAPAALAQSGQLMKVTADSDVDPALEQYADAVRVIGALSEPTDFVVTDHPYLTFLAQRQVPPALVDTSRSRIRSRSLRAGEAVAISSAYDPRLVVLWTDRLRALRDFKAWVEDEYRLVKVYNRRQDLDRGIYVRRHDADLPSIRERLTLGTTAVGADFGNLRLVSAGIDRPAFRHGEGAGLTFHWEATGKLPADYHVLTVLRSGDGQAWDQQQESLAGGSVGTSEWAIGHWLFQNTFVRGDSRIPPGDYSVGVSVYNSRTRQLVPLADGRSELPVAQVEVHERVP
jgi:hypothetical protein